VKIDEVGPAPDGDADGTVTIGGDTAIVVTNTFPNGVLPFSGAAALLTFLGLGTLLVTGGVALIAVRRRGRPRLA